jgi:hypothetical protein
LKSTQDGRNSEVELDWINNNNSELKKNLYVYNTADNNRYTTRKFEEEIIKEGFPELHTIEKQETQETSVL